MAAKPKNESSENKLLKRKNRNIQRAFMKLKEGTNPSCMRVYVFGRGGVGGAGEILGFWFV